MIVCWESRKQICSYKVNNETNIYDEKSVDVGQKSEKLDRLYLYTSVCQKNYVVNVVYDDRNIIS